MASSAETVRARARTFVGGIVSLLLLASMGGCFDEPEDPAGPEAESQESMEASLQRSLVPAEHERFPNADEKRALFGEEHTGFAGIYREPDRGNLVVQVTTDADGPAVVDAMRGSHQYRRLFDRMPGVETETVERNFLSLYRAKLKLSEMIGQDGVWGVDIEEPMNGLEVLAHPGRKADAEDAVLRSGVDRDMVTVVEKTSPTPLVASLDDHYRPPIGPLMITANDTATVKNTQACTLGAPVLPGPDSTAGMLTASHCDHQGTCEGTSSSTVAAQPRLYDDGGSVLVDSIIATEHSDPNETFGACTADVAFYDWVPGISHDHAVIAAGGDPDAGRDDSNGDGVVPWDSTTIMFSLDEFEPIENDPVEKIGQTTGWTTGSVNDTCVNKEGVSCAHEVAGDAASMAFFGDSGAPVFMDDGGVRAFAGILFAGDDPNGDGEWEIMWFSTHSSIEQRFGTWVDVDRGIGWDTTVDGPTFVQPNNLCFYEAEVSGGDPPYVYEWYKDENLIAADTTSGTKSQQQINVGTSDFELLVEATDDRGETTGDRLSVTVDFQGQECGL